MPTVAPLDLPEHCLKVGFLNDIPHFVTVDGTVHWLDGGHKHSQLHEGVLSASFASTQLLTGGEDGKTILSAPLGDVIETHETGNKWITALAHGLNHSFAWATGRQAFIRMPDGKITNIDHERSVEAIAFAPKGLRLALAHYNGVTLHFPGTASAPKRLEWKGAHTGADFSPDGKYLITTMQENALHGWRLSDNQDLRMSGYPAKVKGWSWSAKGKHLATTGAPAAIVWPFLGKDGPIGKAPLELGTRGNQLVTACACHPTEDVVAIGYDDGMILAARFGDNNEVVLRRGGDSAITTIAWDKAGFRAAFGSETGQCGVVDIRA